MVPVKTALQRMMTLLARRDHSERELRQKLRRYHETSDVNQAIQYATDRGWLRPAEELSKIFAEQLDRQKKSSRMINHRLRQKGLPSRPVETEAELEKARQLIDNRLARLARPVDSALRKKLGRFLLGRGFAPGIVRKVIYEKL